MQAQAIVQQHPLHIACLYNYARQNPVVDWLEKYGREHGYVPDYCEETTVAPSEVPTVPPSAIATEVMSWLSTFTRASPVNARHSVQQTARAIRAHVPLILNPRLQNGDIIVTPLLLVSASICGRAFATHVCTPYVAIELGSSCVHKEGMPLGNAVAVRHLCMLFATAHPLVRAIRDHRGTESRSASHPNRKRKRSSEKTESTCSATTAPDPPRCCGIVVGTNWSIQCSMRVQLATVTPPACAYADALAWYRRMATNSPQLVPGSVIEMCANRKAPNTRWASALHQIARETDEMTQLYYCGFQTRQKAWDDHGARTYHDLLKLGDTLSLPPVVSAIVWSNHRDNRSPTISPRRLKLPKHRAFIAEVRRGPWFSVDFETIRVPYTFTAATSPRTTAAAAEGGSLFIFMITACFVSPAASATTMGPVHHKMRSWRMRCLTADEQWRVLQEWMTWMREMIGAETALSTVPIVHWAPAEPRFLRQVLEGVATGIGTTPVADAEDAALRTALRQLRWEDVLAIFLAEPIVVPGSFDFKLKHIARALHALHKITHSWDDDVTNGLQAMQMAYGCYQHPHPHPHQHQRTSIARTFANIQRYNENDTRVLLDIVCFLIREMG
jgi:hypothetical protein